MTLPTSLIAYCDCRQLFDAAVADPTGARMEVGTYDAGIHFRMRMNYFRTLDRKANASIYQSGHPLHGASIYDEYHQRLLEDETGSWWLYVEKRTSKLGTIEALSEVDGDA